MRIPALLALLLTALPVCSHAADNPIGPFSDPDDPTHSKPTTFRIGFETIKLPQNESMGLVGGSYLFQITPEIYAGPAAYGAATGKRGGFFTGGGEVLWKHKLVDKLSVSTGVYVGGGGGGAASVGGGLMVRPHVDLTWTFDTVSVGISGSQVRFPNGQIKSKQVGLIVEFDDDFIYASPDRIGQSLRSSQRGGIGFDRIAVVTGVHRPKAGVKDTAGNLYAQSIGYAGFRADRSLSKYVYWGLESGAAIHGGADGYAEVLASAGVEAPLFTDFLKVGARFAAGLGGGGKVSTGGGIIAKAALTGKLQLTDTIYVGLEGGIMRAPKGDFKSRFATVNLGIDLDAPPASYLNQSLQGSEWGAKFTHYSAAARYNGNAQSFDTLGFAMNRSLDKHWYYSGQALSAMDGQAGGFSMGLVGLGYHSSPLISKISAGVELLAGAAGGGGVNSKGGAVAQAIAYAAMDLDNGMRIKLGVGRVYSFKGALRSPVFDVAVSVPFTVPGV